MDYLVAGNCDEGPVRDDVIFILPDKVHATPLVYTSLHTLIAVEGSVLSATLEN